METNLRHVERLIEQLSPNQLAAVERLLEVMLDPVANSIANAPIDDDQVGPELAAELDEAHASIARGEGIPHEQVMREFGLSSNL